MVSPSKPSSWLSSGLAILYVPFLLMRIAVVPPVPAPVMVSVIGIAVSTPEEIPAEMQAGIEFTTGRAATRTGTGSLSSEV